MPDVLGPAARPSHVLALRWTALDADNDPITPALALQRAGSVAAFFAATRAWVAPMRAATDAGGLSLPPKGHTKRGLVSANSRMTVTLSSACNASTRVSGVAFSKVILMFTGTCGDRMIERPDKS